MQHRIVTFNRVSCLSSITLSVSLTFLCFWPLDLMAAFEVLESWPGRCGPITYKERGAEGIVFISPSQNALERVSFEPAKLEFKAKNKIALKNSVFKDNELKVRTNEGEGELELQVRKVIPAPEDGEWSFINGLVEMQLDKEGRRYFFDAMSTPLKIVIPKDQQPQIVLPENTILSGRKDKPALPKGGAFVAKKTSTKIRVTTENSVKVAASYFLPHGNINFSKTWLPNGILGTNAQLSLSKPNLDFSKREFNVCTLIEGGNTYEAIVKEVQQKNNKPGSASLTFVLPETLDDTNFWPWRLVDIIVVASDGSFGATGKMQIAQFWPTFLMAWGLILVVFVLLSLRAQDKIRKQTGQKPSFASSLLIGRTGKISLSQFQMWLWTFLVAGGMVYVLCLTGELFTLNTEVLILLGFAGGGSLGARFVAIRRQEEGYRNAGFAVVPEASYNARVSDLVVTADRVDLFKFQMLIFTLIIAAYVLVRILTDHTFPEIPPSMLILMGISNGVYVASKTGGSTVFTKIESFSIELELKKGELINLQSELKTISDKINEIDIQLAKKKSNLGQLPVGPEKLKLQGEINALEEEGTDKKKVKSDLEGKEKALKDSINELQANLQALFSQLNAEKN